MIEPDVWAEILDIDNRRAKELIDMWHKCRVGQQYTQADVKREAHRILSTLWHAKAPPSTDILSLFAEILELGEGPFVPPPPNKNIPVKNQKAFEAAARFEARHSPDKTGVAPSTAYINSVSKAAFPETAANRRPEVRKWRQMPEYWERVKMYRNYVNPILERVAVPGMLQVLKEDFELNLPLRRVSHLPSETIFDFAVSREAEIRRKILRMELQVLSKFNDEIQQLEEGATQAGIRSEPDFEKHRRTDLDKLQKRYNDEIAEYSTAAAGGDLTDEVISRFLGPVFSASRGEPDMWKGGKKRMIEIAIEIIREHDDAGRQDQKL